MSYRITKKGREVLKLLDKNEEFLRYLCIYKLKRATKVSTKDLVKLIDAQTGSDFKRLLHKFS